MAPVPTPAVDAIPRPLLRRLLGDMSIFTLLMTIPQVLTIWLGRQAAGVSVWSWGAYLLSALLWFFMDCRNVTRISTCHALVGSRSTAALSQAF